MDQFISRRLFLFRGTTAPAGAALAAAEAGEAARVIELLKKNGA